MVKLCLIIIGFVIFTHTPLQAANAENGPQAKDMYVTTEDIVLDLIFPIVDKRVIKEYGGGPLFDWHLQKIVGITYNDNHSYDVAVRITIPSDNGNVKEDLVRVRVAPSCDSGKINKQVCNHGFKLEIVEYKHVSE
ncbi:hypothetical protein [Bacillus sp. SG-1]|uniref:hypothetical protein n=1 Tax=Bacillus sp. SG-1 TaxID=161544 RepID=UPI0002EC659B|nr:hypothetical protein [Bacillus sp. SG-1]